jgi:NADH-ubiquinone oxidoreductase chain 2
MKNLLYTNKIIGQVMIFISILILIVAKAIPSLNNQLSNIGFQRISAIIFIFSGVLSFNTLYIQSIGSGLGIYSGLFHITQISQLIETFLLIIGGLILIAWPLIIIKNNYNRITLVKGSNYSTDYSLIVLFSTFGSCLLISSSDLISLYLSIELQSFGLYILSTLYRDSETSTSAGLKYFLLGGLSSCLILLGSGLIYSYTGLTNLESLYSLISVSEINLVIQGFSLGIIILIIGFLFKIAAAPLHNWSPDVYDETPTIVTIWLTIMPKIAILILLLELYSQIGLVGPFQIINNSFNSLTLNSSCSALAGQPATVLILPISDLLSGASEITNISKLNLLSIISPENTVYLLKNLLLISSVLSLIIGSIVGLAQIKVKRLLAYSTISHIGFMLLALQINTEIATNSFLFYIIQYTITNLDIFLILIALSYLIKTYKNELSEDNTSGRLTDISYINELKGQFYSNPLLSISLAICLFSMAGIPPLIGFFSKQYVLISAMQNGYYFISILAIILSIVSASYYLKIITVLFKETSGLPAKAVEKKVIFTRATEKALTNTHSFLIANLTLLILFFILKPTLILNSTLLLSLSIFSS